MYLGIDTTGGIHVASYMYNFYFFLFLIHYIVLIYSCADLSANVAASLQPSASFVMLGLKRDRAGRPQGNRNGELGAQLRDLVAENKLPTTRIESLVGGVRDIVPQALPALPRVRRGLNLSHPYRSYARAFLRGSVWPRLYWARIRCLNTKTKR